MCCAGRAEGAGVAVVGAGNLIMKDEGVGIHALRALRDGEGPEGALYLEGGTSLWRVLPETEDCDTLVVLDALDTGEEPGTVCSARIEETTLETDASSLHRTSLRTALAHAEMQGNGFEDIVVVGMQPAEVSAGLQLSKVCARRLHKLLAVAGKIIRDPAAAAGNTQRSTRHAGNRTKARG